MRGRRQFAQCVNRLKLIAMPLPSGLVRIVNPASRKSSKLFVAGVAHARPPITASRTQMSWIPSLRACRVNGMK